MPLSLNAYNNVIYLILFLISSSPVVEGLEFEIDYHESIPVELREEVIRAVDLAAAKWAEVLLDDVTITFDLRWVDSFPNPAEGGRASVYYMPVPYFRTRAALTRLATSNEDRESVAFLPEDLPMLINRTSDNPNGAGSELPYIDDTFDDNNRTMRLSLANARILGLYPEGLDFQDGRITMSGRPNWDYDPTDGISSGKSDFYAIVLHEIGHVLGMNSLLDARLGLNPGQPSDFYSFLTPLDLFRYSRESAEQGVIDWTADDRPKYISHDGGATTNGMFATGVFGDRADPSHWARDGQIDGIFEPVVFPGQEIEYNDLLALDLIGWTVQHEPKRMRITSARMTETGLELEWTQLPEYRGYRVFVSEVPDKTGFKVAKGGTTEKSSWKSSQKNEETRFYYVEAYR